MKIDTKKNYIVCGDNLDWLQSVPDESVDVCYIDPPFFSNRNYEVIWGNGYELRSFGDRFAGGISHYIEWMRPRVDLIHRKLKKTGSIFLHCDWHASHRLRCMLDDIFGEQNFVNEIVWVRSRNPKGSQHEVRSLSTFTDTILMYGKTDKFKFYHDRIRRELTEEQIEAKYDRKDELGRFTDGPIVRSESMGERPNLSYKYKGFDPSPWGWRMEKGKLAEIDKKGNLGWSSAGKPYRKIRPDEDRGEVVSNFWDDIDQINPQSKERLGYPTQKPELLVRRILELASDEGDVVLDCFGGGGTTAKVATDLNRKFITGDVSPVSVKIMAERLYFDCPGISFNIKNLPQTEGELKDMNGHDFVEVVCEVMGWEMNSRKSGDGGIDAWAGDKVPVQVKNHSKSAAGRPDMQKFFGAMAKERSKKGIFVAWEFSKDALGFIADMKREHKVDIVAMKCGEVFGALLLDGSKGGEIEKLYLERRPKNWVKDAAKSAKVSSHDKALAKAAVGKQKTKRGRTKDVSSR